ncbi:MAG: hypothetical protein J7498_15930 [Sphingobium sp.]|nr:hypothetical protein [Sphingobium sp.]
MLSNWMAYLQYQMGSQLDASGKLDGYSSWSAQLLGSVHWWMWLEATHVVTLTVFAGSILFVDLRLLGLVLPGTPISRINRSLLPLTVGGFAVLVITGTLVFFGKPFEYYHNFAFRLKLLFLLFAAVNIFIFHARVQASQAAWDDVPRPPTTVRLAAALSLLSWVLVIGAGRGMAYERFTCAKAESFVAAIADCDGQKATLAAIAKDVSL